MADPLSGIAVIICIAFGVLTFVLLFIFANRQIKRFSLKSKSGPHIPIAQDAPKSLQNEINRRLDIVRTISYQPPLLKKSDEIFFQEEHSCHMPVHLYRMKALDTLPALDAAILSAEPSRNRPPNQDYRVYLVRLAQSGLLGQIEIATIHKFCDLYESARHEPGDFAKEHYTQFMDLMTQIQQSISTRSSCKQHSVAKTVSSSAQTTESTRHITNGKVPAVPSCLQVEPSLEEKKATYETSV